MSSRWYDYSQGKQSGSYWKKPSQKARKAQGYVTCMACGHWKWNSRDVGVCCNQCGVKFAVKGEGQDKGSKQDKEEGDKEHTEDEDKSEVDLKGVSKLIEHAARE